MIVCWLGDFWASSTGQTDMNDSVDVRIAAPQQLKRAGGAPVW